MRAAIPWNKFVWVRETPRLRKVKEGEIFFKLYWDKEKSKFISLVDYFALLLVLYICDFYNYLPVFEMKLILWLIVSDE